MLKKVVTIVFVWNSGYALFEVPFNVLSENLESRLCSENIAVLSFSFIAMFAQIQFLPHKMALRPLKTIMTCHMLLLLIMMNEWWWRWWEQKWRKTLRQTDFRHTENIRSSCCNNIYTSRQNNLNYWLANSSIHENGFFLHKVNIFSHFSRKGSAISLKELIILKNGSKIADIF